MTPKQQAFDDSMRLRAKALDARNPQHSLIWHLLAKSVAHEAGLASLTCDLIGEVAEVREKINRERKREGMPPTPVNTWGGANMSDEELLEH